MTDDVLARLQRLRNLGVYRGMAGMKRPAAPKSDNASVEIPGQVVDTPFGPAWVRVERYPLTQHSALAQLLEARAEAVAGAGRDPALAGLIPAKAAFIDTETTGLSTGTDTYTFLIGIGTYECTAGDLATSLQSEPSGECRSRPDSFVVRQFFMRNPAEERAQLELVERLLGECTGIVSFNGRSFDIPLLNTRFTLAGVYPLPMAGVPHLDLLPVARRVWRARLASCSLSELERSVLAIQRSADDVSGWMIPGIYRDYYRTGIGAEMIARVFYHNLTDIVSMALLAGRLTQLFELSLLQQHLLSLHPLDCVSLARCYAALEWAEACEAAYRAALAHAVTDTDRSLVFRELGMRLKRMERRAEAAALWEEWIGTVAAGDDLTPYVELAKYHEWHTGDLPAARGWTAWALHSIERLPRGIAHEELNTELQRRLDRIQRKMAAADAAASPSDLVPGQDDI